MERQTHQKPPWARSRPQLEKAESQGAGITEVISGGTMGDMEIRQISRCDNSSKSMFWRLWHVELKKKITLPPQIPPASPWKPWLCCPVRYALLYDTIVGSSTFFRDMLKY